MTAHEDRTALTRIMVLIGVVTACFVGFNGSSLAARAASTSNNIYLCAFSANIGYGRVYAALGISPKYVGPESCRAFNHQFGGRREPIGRLGNGHVYCRFASTPKGVTIALEVFANRPIAGRKFCRAFTAIIPKGWRRV